MPLAGRRSFRRLLAGLLTLAVLLFSGGGSGLPAFPTQEHESQDHLMSVAALAAVGEANLGALTPPG
jgi:hypothetical protein